MHDLNMRLFYKTSFDVEAISPNGDALWSVVTDVRRWICDKYNKALPVIRTENYLWTNLKFGKADPDLNTSDGSVIFDAAALWNEDGSGSWACSITETEVAEGFQAPREWRTEVGFEQESRSKGVFSVVLSFGDAPGYLAPAKPEPSLTIPNLVWNIANDHHINCTVMGIPVAKGPVVLKADDMEGFFDILSNPNRGVPVVVVSPTKEGELLVDPALVARALGPSGLVFSWENQCVNDVIRATLPKNFWCLGGRVRVYATRPRFERVGEQKRHRFFSREQIAELGADEVIRVLRRALAADVHFYEDMLQVSRLRMKRKLYFQKVSAEKRIVEVRDSALKEKAKTESAESEAFALMEENDRLEWSYDELCAHAEELDDSLQKLRTEMWGLEQQNSALSEALNTRDRASREIDDLPVYPSTPERVMWMFESAYPDDLALTERARASLKGCNSSPEVLWNALHDLMTLALPLYRKNESDIKGEFERNSSFRFATSAGMQTRKASGLMKEYRDTIAGREINAETHLAKGNNDANQKSIRLYFAYVREEDRMVISYCGGHLRNFTTQSVH